VLNCTYTKFSLDNVCTLLCEIDTASKARVESITKFPQCTLYSVQYYCTVPVLNKNCHEYWVEAHPKSRDVLSIAKFPQCTVLLYCSRSKQKVQQVLVM
jgi:hypothetical protein